MFRFMGEFNRGEGHRGRREAGGEVINNEDTRGDKVRSKLRAFVVQFEFSDFRTPDRPASSRKAKNGGAGKRKLRLYLNFPEGKKRVQTFVPVFSAPEFSDITLFVNFSLRKTGLTSFFVNFSFRKIQVQSIVPTFLVEKTRTNGCTRKFCSGKNGYKRLYSFSRSGKLRFIVCTCF